MESNGITLDFSTNAVVVDGKTSRPPKKIFKIIHFMMENPNRIISRTELLKNCWEDGVIVGDRTIDVHICKIRKYLKDPSRLALRKGYGYIWEENN